MQSAFRFGFFALALLAALVILPAPTFASIDDSTAQQDKLSIPWVYRLTLLRHPSSNELAKAMRLFADHEQNEKELKKALRKSDEGRELLADRKSLHRYALKLSLLMASMIGILTILAYRANADASRMHLALKLSAFLFINSIFLNLILSFTARSNVLVYFRNEFANPGHMEDDSWSRMKAAARAIHTHREMDVYTHLRDNEGIVFAYPLTALLIVDPFKHIQINSALNWVSFALTWLTSLFAALAFSRTLLHQYGGKSHFFWESLWFVISACFTFLFHPIIKGLLLGQAQTIITTLFSASLFFFLIRRKATAGVTLGLACAIKPQLGFLLVWGLLRRDYRFSAGLFFAIFSLGLISLGVYGFHENFAYLDALNYLSRHSWSFFDNQSFNGLLQRALFNGPNLDWAEYAPYSPLIHRSTLAVFAALTIVSLAWKPPEHVSPSLMVVDFSIASLVCTMSAPVAWGHHYGILLPVFAMLAPVVLRRSDFAGLSLTVISFILISNAIRATDLLAATRWNFFQSYTYFGALILLFQLFRLRSIMKAQSEDTTGRASGKAESSLITPCLATR